VAPEGIRLGPLRVVIAEVERPIGAAKHRNYAEGLALFRQIGSVPGVANSRVNLGTGCLDIGLTREAIEHSLAGLELFRTMGAAKGVARRASSTWRSRH
jgi:hypothetical protein